jgi:hypothetical protein
VNRCAKDLPGEKRPDREEHQLTSALRFVPPDAPRSSSRAPTLLRECSSFHPVVPASSPDSKPSVLETVAERVGVQYQAVVVERSEAGLVRQILVISGG